MKNYYYCTHYEFHLDTCKSIEISSVILAPKGYKIFKNSMKEKKFKYSRKYRVFYKASEEDINIVDKYILTRMQDI